MAYLHGDLICCAMKRAHKYDVNKSITTDDPLNQVQSVPVDNQGTNADSSVQSTDDVTQIVTTRSGCMIRPPKWQKDYSL